MKNKKIFKFTNILFAIGIIFSVGVLIKSYIDKSKLPEGVCPINNNRELLIAAIIVLIVITIITTFIEYIEKKNS